jgi:hypothetical protein
VGALGHDVGCGEPNVSERPYISAEIAHEKVIKKSEIPYSIVHATQFVELVKKIADDPRSSNPSPPRYSQKPSVGRGGHAREWHR